MKHIKKYNKGYSVEYAGKYGGHGELTREYDFDKAVEEAKSMKREHIQKEIDDEVLDKTIYIGVSSNDKFAIIYMTIEYYNHIKAHTKDDDIYGKQWLEVADKYIETGKSQIGEYSE